MSKVVVLIPRDTFDEGCRNILHDHGYEEARVFPQHMSWADRLFSFENLEDEDSGEFVCDQLRDYSYFSIWVDESENYTFSGGVEYNVPFEGNAVLLHITPMVPVSADGSTSDLQMQQCREFYRLKRIFQETLSGNGPQETGVDGDALSRLG